MAAIELLSTTGNDRIDQILRGVVGVFEAAFPGRARGYFLMGSYADGSATPSSDLDLGILFRGDHYDRAEGDRAVRLCQDCEAISAMLLEMWVMGEDQLLRADRYGTALQIALGSRLLYGEQSPAVLAARVDARYVRWAMHIPMYGHLAMRGRPAVLRYPLDYPDPAGPLYGYDRPRHVAVDETEQREVKPVVAIVGRIATALVALRTGHYVRNKRESVEFYRAYIADDWTDLVEQVYTICRGRWDYTVPSDPAERQQLRLLCQRALAFENAFLLTYRDYLLGELRLSDSEYRLLALECLGQIIYPMPEVRVAVQELTRDVDERVRQAAEMTLRAMSTSMPAQDGGLASTPGRS